MGFDHPNASIAWEAKELTPGGIKNVLVVETHLVLKASADGHDPLAVTNLLSAPNQYLVQNGERLAEPRMPSIQDISKQVRRGGSRNPLAAGDALFLHWQVEELSSCGGPVGKAG